MNVLAVLVLMSSMRLRLVCGLYRRDMMALMCCALRGEVAFLIKEWLIRSVSDAALVVMPRAR